MSRRTAASNKAIREAWKSEKDLVKEGKGTRDWTIDQQKDILDRGKAYDENGKAFEGQHMRSAEVHPECQGDPKNIQFLTRAEHLDAHGGSWRNPTNWYYDPVTKEKHDFGDGPIIPCKVSELSKPLREGAEKRVQADRETKGSSERTKLDVASAGSESKVNPAREDNIGSIGSAVLYALVMNVVVTIVEEEPPLLFNLNDLQAEANRRYGLTAAETLACIQHIYEEGGGSYPRTSSRQITSDMEKTVLSLLTD